MLEPPHLHFLPFPAPMDARFKELEGAVVALGNFDGVHLGHKAVIERTVQLAQSCKARPMLLTFEPHPNVFFKPDQPFFRLTSPRVKAAVAQHYQCGATSVLPFNQALASLNADDFLTQVLGKMLRISGVVVGHDFHFGFQRQGNPDFLKKWCVARGIPVDVIQAITTSSQVISSTRIRRALEEGLVEAANDLLGYRWMVSGVVEQGAQNGRKLGFPKANIAIGSDCQLKHGVYAVRVRIEGEKGIWSGAASFGRRPMFDNGAPLLEVFLMDFEGDLYGKTLWVEFVAFIRFEARFATLDAMIAKMHQDVDDVRAALKIEQSTSLWDV